MMLMKYTTATRFLKFLFPGWNAKELLLSNYYIHTYPSHPLPNILICISKEIGDGFLKLLFQTNSL
jgi:hypothetical protein